MENLDPELQNRFTELPIVIQSAIRESHWQEKIRTIAKKHNLRVDQGSALEMETAFVMLGFETPEYFIPNLETNMEIKNELAFEIAREVDMEIFREIKQKLVLAGEIKDEEEVEKETKADIIAENRSEEREIEESRDEILRAIEDEPHPSSQTSSTPQKTNTEIQTTQSVIVKPETQTAETQTPPNPEKNNEQTPSVVAQKLSNPTLQNAQTKNYPTDPYREPIE